MRSRKFTPLHINATEADLAGNNGIGRYIFFTGSDGRAKEIAKHFENAQTKIHPRAHNLYTGCLTANGVKIEVAAISGGMGCASTEIILHELYHLGAKRFLRVGTSGSLQPGLVNITDIINVRASVRDENTTLDYAPREVPAVASSEFHLPILQAAKNLGLSGKLHTGTVHCKSSFYAREFGAGPRSQENEAYLALLRQNGVLASEMETATLFIQSQIYNYRSRQDGAGPANKVLAGAILAILSIPPHEFATSVQAEQVTHDLIELSLETIKLLALAE